MRANGFGWAAGCWARTGRRFTVVRRKGLKSTLADLDGQPIPEDEWKAFLGGIDRETFVRVFGLSREELVSGGKVILEGKGGVGESLFAAGLGGADLKKVLDTLDAEAGELVQTDGNPPRLNAEAKAFKELKTRIRDLFLASKRLGRTRRHRFSARGTLPAAQGPNRPAFRGGRPVEALARRLAANGRAQGR